jgi:hypothetical protein
MSPFSRANDHPRMGERSHSCWCACVARGTNVRPWAHGKVAKNHPRRANVRFLSRFGILEMGLANDHPRRANIRFLSRFSTLKKDSGNDHPRRANVRFLSVPIPTVHEENNNNNQNQNENKRKE